MEALAEEGEAVRASLDGERRYRYCLDADADRIPRLTEDTIQSCPLLTNFWRIIPKMDRKRGNLIIHSVWHEPWFEADERFNDAFSKTLDRFAEFNDAENIEILNDQPKIG